MYLNVWAVLLGILVLDSSVGDGCETRIEVTGWTGPAITGVSFRGPIKCWIGHICVWEVMLNWAAATTAEMTLNPTFDPPLFYTLPRANIQSFQANETQFIEVPPLSASKAGQYTLSLYINATGLKVTLCPTNFTVAEVPAVRQPVPKVPNLALKEQYYNIFKTRIAAISLPLSTRCDPVFNVGLEENQFNYDPIFTHTISTLFNVTNEACLLTLRAKWIDYLYRNFSTDYVREGSVMRMWPEGLVYHARYFDPNFDPIPHLKYWHTFSKLLSVGARREWQFASSINTIAMMHLMALTGHKELLLPRSISLLCDSMYEQFLNPNNVSDVLYPAYRIPGLYYWYDLTGDQRIPFLVDLLRQRAEIWLNVTDQSILLLEGVPTPDLTVYPALLYSISYQLFGEESYRTKALQLINASLHYAYDGKGKHANQKVRLNYMALAYLFEPDRVKLTSVIPFEFPTFTNGTTILPNTTLEVSYNVTIEGDLVMTDNSLIEITPGQVLTVAGCANFDSTLVINTDEIEAKNDTVLIVFACSEGEFNNLVVTGDDPNDCTVYSLLYSPVSVTLLVDAAACSVTGPDVVLKDWEIALIVVLPLVTTGLIVTVVLVVRAKAKQRKRRTLSKQVSQ